MPHKTPYECDSDLIAISFENAPDVMFLYDSDGTLIDGNKEAEKFTGYSREELRGKNLLKMNLIAPEDILRAADNIKKISLGEKTQPNEYAVTRKDGKRVYIETRGYTVAKQKKKIILAIGRDVTERKRIESDLSKKRGEYKKLIEQASDAIGILGQNLIIYANDAMAKLVGYKNSEELIGQPVQPFYHSSYSNLMEKYTLARRNGQYAPPRYETKIINHFNEAIDVEVQVTIIEWEGKPAALAILRDITQQKIFETRRSAIYKLTSKLGHSNTIEEITEETLEIINEILCYEIVTFHLLENNKLVNIGSQGFCPIINHIKLEAKSIIAKAARKKSIINVPDVSKDSDFFCEGELDIKSEMAVPILSGDTVYGVINIESKKLDFYKKEDEILLELLCLHVSSAINRVKNDYERKKVERKLFESQIRYEQEKEMNKLKTRFLSTAAHELRTPITSLQGYMELFQENYNDLNEKQKQYSKVIQRNIQKLAILTDDLLNMQRLEEGRVTLNVQKVNVKKIIQDLINEFTPILNEKKQILHCNSIEKESHLDGLRIMQVLINLLSKEVAYTST